jgi:hypothetical protein
LSQYYPQQPNPFYPPKQNPEEDYYDYDDFEYDYDDDDGEEDSGNNLTKVLLAVLGGGCLIFLCLACCGLVGVGLWYLDPGSSLVATAIPGSDIGLTFAQPAYPDESVVNEKGMKLTILDVNRNAALPAVVPAEGGELIIVTIELVNLGSTESGFNERDFVLLNTFEEAYQPIPGVVDGALGRGSLPPSAGLEGRLVYEVAAGEVDLVLRWDGGPDTQPRYIWLE